MDAHLRVLVVDQDVGVLDRVPNELEREGFDVRIAASSDRALDYLHRWLPHVAVVDARVDMLSEIRERDPDVHVLLTGVDDDEGRVRALREGADDCVGRTCSAREISARVAAVARRYEQTMPPTLDFGALRIDCAARKVHVDDRVVEMPRRELDLLIHLASNPGRTFTREELLRSVWGSSSGWQHPSTVTEHVRRIRQKLERDPFDATWLVTVRGVGYRFEPGTGEADPARVAARRRPGWPEPPAIDLRDSDN